MKQIRLGQSGPMVSCLGYGAMSFSDFYGVTTDENSFAILDEAMEAGVTHLDTANVYGMGRSERVIGDYLRARPEARDYFTIATKAAITRDGEGNRIFRNDPEHLEAELDASLQRLGVEAVDLFYAHRRDKSRPIEETAEALGVLVRKGKAKAIGLSEISPTSLARAHAVHPVAAVQSEYSLSTRSPDLGLVQGCARIGATFVAFSPVGRSFLTDTPLSWEAVQSLPFLAANPRFSAETYPANIAATDAFRALAAEMGTSAAALAIAWTLAQGDHVLPIPGTRSLAHFRQHIEGANMTLTTTDLAAIETVLPAGWAHGDRYSDEQWIGPERFC
ncbi:aldo/keto reductase [Nioella sediminis]|jgi:aryl-alcohol dehydrogenase-like predicted oxidoreductase|uniref:aldo/keto reductase n=1 Tax=Nioella sediminis TaxID=1912092 RepID=UPI0008FD1ADF|nr:aldo/keto reductase [Nioella sediminis]TBX15190.1 aldo/keto reductase [Roseovarius sp. JS7-11]